MFNMRGESALNIIFSWNKLLIIFNHHIRFSIIFFLLLWMTSVRAEKIVFHNLYIYREAKSNYSRKSFRYWIGNIFLFSFVVFLRKRNFAWKIGFPRKTKRRKTYSLASICTCREYLISNPFCSIADKIFNIWNIRARLSLLVKLCTLLIYIIYLDIEAIYFQWTSLPMTLCQTIIFTLIFRTYIWIRCLANHFS